MKNAVAAIGMCSWDRFLVTSQYPGPGQYAIVDRTLEQAGGTTANTCAALAKVGIEVMLASFVGEDLQGQLMIESLQEAGCNVSNIDTKQGQVSDSSYIIVSNQNGSLDRTIFWLQGARPQIGDLLPVDALLEHRWLILDVEDSTLRSFWLDLPAHRSPRTQLIGLMTYLVELNPIAGLEQALRCDIIIGNQTELLYLTGESEIDRAIDVARKSMLGQACRAMYISRGAQGACAISQSGLTFQPAVEVEVVDTTGAGDSFAAGCIWGLIDTVCDQEILQRGIALGSLTCTALGARTAQPSRQQAMDLLQQYSTPS